jgi:hypothetical protein
MHTLNGSSPVAGDDAVVTSSTPRPSLALVGAQREGAITVRDLIDRYCRWAGRKSVIAVRNASGCSIHGK